ncbi:hypothetical protein ANO14919_012120 [Xylariales sp. No.14919]|nr:hypothetical protein F5X98DRAFT_342180 [Xylaria grammica]GAW11859.1 hypothetical protein ANO14919_012120 [Xylariales sp. No.14919]
MVAEDNPFVRFKNHIDANVRRGLDVLFGSSVAPPTTSTSPSSTSSSVLVASNTDSSNSTPTSEQQKQASSVSASPPSPSPRFKMSDTSSNRASNANTSDQHSTSPTSPTTTSTTISTSTIDDVHNWAVQSPYSPLNLQHLNQPTPNGVPRAWEGHFTFRDAFEDLLVAGSGKPLPSTREIMHRKVWGGNDHFSHRGMHVTNWVNALGTLGLWDAYFRLEMASRRDWRDRDERDRFQRRLRFRETAPFASVSLPGLRVGVGGWSREEDGERDEVARGHFDAKGVWNGAWRVVKDREGRWEAADGEDRGGGDADVEDELYKANWSDFDAASSHREGSGSDGKRTDSGAVEPVDVTTGLRKPTAPEVTTTVYADGSRHVRKTERIERDGRTEVSTTERFFDAQGNLLSESRGTSKSQTWSGSIPGAGAEASFSWSWNKSNVERGSNSERDDDENRRWGDRKDEKGGWFWNR